MGISLLVTHHPLLITICKNAAGGPFDYAQGRLFQHPLKRIPASIQANLAHGLLIRNISEPRDQAKSCVVFRSYEQLAPLSATNKDVITHAQ